MPSQHDSCTEHFDLECQFFGSDQPNTPRRSLSFVRSIAAFMKNFETCFKASLWIQAINFQSFHISGGCIVDSLCKHSPTGNLAESVDINFNGNSFFEFDVAVNLVHADLVKIQSKKNSFSSVTLVKRSSACYIIALLPTIQLRFNFKNVSDNMSSVSYVLHSSDIDASQIAFTGEKISDQSATIFYVFDRRTRGLYGRFLASDGNEIIHLLYNACNHVEKHIR